VGKNGNGRGVETDNLDAGDPTPLDDAGAAGRGGISLAVQIAGENIQVVQT